MRTIVILPFVLAACGFTPESGTYTLTPGEGTTDCEATDDTGETDMEPVDVEIAVAEDETAFTLTFPSEEGDQTFDCALGGNDFTCDPFELAFDLDATTSMSFSMTISGQWTSSTAFDGTMDADQSCTGDNCETYEIETCSSSQDFSGEQQ